MKPIIIITGAAGFVGSNLYDMLQAQFGDQYQLVGIDVVGDKARVKIFRDVGSFSTVSWIKSDLQHYYGKDFQVKYIFHLAALARIQPSFDNPLETYRVNVMGTANMCELARDLKAKLIFSGTSSKLHDPYMAPYTNSKVAAEGVILTYNHCFQMPYAICTFYNVYGPREPGAGEFGTVVGKFLRLFRQGEAMTIVGDGQQARQFTHVADICRGMIAAAECELDGSFQLSSGTLVTIKEITDFILANVPEDERGKYITYVPLRKNEAQVITADAKELEWTRNTLQWKPQETLRDFIENLQSS